MEAITAISKNLLKNTMVAIGVGAILGLILGLLIGWVIWPVQWTNGTPEVLREDLQDDYMRMTIESFSRTGDLDAAVRRWDELGDAAGPTLLRVQANPGGLDQAAIEQYTNVIQAAKGPIQATPGAETPSGGSSLIIYAAIAVLVILVAVAPTPYSPRNSPPPVSMLNDSSYRSSPKT
jgi:hypothetical protein